MHLLLALLLGIPTGLPPAWSASGCGVPAVGRRDDQRELRARVAEALWPGADPVARGAALRALREEAYELLFEVLCSGSIPAGWSGPDGPALALDLGASAAVEAALAAAPARCARPFLDRLADTEARPAWRLKAVELLGAGGSGRDVALMLRLAEPLEPVGGALPLRLRKTLERALVVLVQRVPEACGEIFRGFEGAHEGLRMAIVDAIARSEHPAALDHLSGLLGVVPEQDAYVLNSMARVAQGVHMPVAAHVLERVRQRMGSEEPAVALSALRVSGILEDVDALPELLRIQGHGGPAERQVAYRALRDLTGLRLRDEPDLWSRWYETERTWWRERLDATLRDLRSGDVEQANRAITSLANRRLDRHRAARCLLEGLRRREVGAVQLACLGLGATGSWVAVEPLIQALGHADPRVRRAAHRALAAITGLDLPPDPRLWTEHT